MPDVFGKYTLLNCKERSITDESGCTKATVATERIFTHAEDATGLFFTFIDVYLTKLAP